MRIGIAVLLLLALLVAAPAAYAEEHEDPGLMKLDWMAMVTAIVVFLILVVVLAKTAWKPILKGLKEREDAIRRAVDEAKEASERARATVAEYEAKLARASEEGRAILEDARKDALRLKADIEAEARKQSEETVQRGVREIGQAKATAWDALVRDAATLATETAARIIRRTLSPEAHADLVDEVVREVSTARRGRA
jgi:F-type H+-transporting ATPase subunit b